MKRFNIIDCFKLFFAYCVVAIHTSLSSAMENPVILNLILGIAVSYFFVCSGYFLQSKLEKATSEQYRKILWNYFCRLAVPYLIWGIWYFVLEIANQVFIDHINVLLVIRGLFIRWILSSPGGGLWYVQTILCIVLILIFFNNKRHSTLVLTIVLAISYLLSRCVLRYNEQSEFLTGIKESIFPNEYNSLNFVCQGIFFMLGIQLKKVMSFVKSTKSMSIISLVIFFVTCLPVCFYSKISNMAIVCVLRVVSLFVFTSCVYTSISEKNTKRIRAMSTMIYFMHFTIIYVVKFFLIICFPEQSRFSVMLFLITSVILTIISFILSGKKWRLLKKIF